MIYITCLAITAWTLKSHAFGQIQIEVNQSEYKFFSDQNNYYKKIEEQLAVSKWLDQNGGLANTPYLLWIKRRLVSLV